MADIINLFQQLLIVCYWNKTLYFPTFSTQEAEARSVNVMIFPVPLLKDPMVKAKLCSNDVLTALFKK
jgi:hypothetical protein